MREAVRIRSPEAVLPLVQKWRRCRQENLLTITLNGAHEVIRVHHISKGLVNKTVAHPRECFHPTVKDMAVAVIFVHNHPSGSVAPSGEDDEITRHMGMAAEIMGINMLDHIIVTPKDNYYSYRQAGRMPDRHEVYELELFAASLGNSYG